MPMEEEVLNGEALEYVAYVGGRLSIAEVFS